MKCYETKRFDTDVPFVLIRVLAQMMTRFNNDEDSKLLADPRVYPAMRDCLTQYVKHRPDSLRRYYLSFRTVLSRQLGNLDDAIDDLIELNDEVHHDALALINSGRSSVFWSGMTLAHEDEHQDVARQLLKLVNRGWDREGRQRNADKIFALIEKGLENNIDPLEQAWFNHFKETIENERKYYEGKWVNFEFEPGNPGWTGSGQHCITVDEAGVLMMDSMKKEKPSRLAIRPNYNLPGPKTLEAEIEVFNPSEKGMFEAGFQFITFNHPERTNAVYFTSFPKSLRTTAVKIHTTFAIKNSHTGKRKLRVNITDGYMEVFVDGQFVNALNGDFIEPGNLIFLGQRVDFSRRGKVSYENLRLRKWDMSPCPLLGDKQGEYDKEEVVDWFEKAQELYPDQPYYAWRIALAHINAGEYKEAATFARKARELGMQPSRTGLMEGYVHDLAGEFEKAIEYYANDLGSDEFPDLHYYIPRVRHVHKTTPETLAIAWKTWLITTSGKPNDRNLELPLPRVISVSSDWTFRRIIAAKNAYEGDYSRAVSMLKSTLENRHVPIPSEMQQAMRDQMSAYEEKKLWQRDMNGKPFYHNLEMHVGPTFLGGVEGTIRH